MKQQTLGQVLLIDSESPQGRFISFEQIIRLIDNLDPAICYSGLILNLREQDPKKSPFRPFMITAFDNERFTQFAPSGGYMIPCGVN